MPVSSDDPLIELLLAQRDEHVRRIYAVNGGAALVALAVSATLFIGAILGIDALAAVDVASPAGWLLVAGGWAFGASALLLALAVIHHARDRRAAASHLEEALARLLAGEERERVLADLARSMTPLLHPARGSRPGSALSTDLRRRWLGLTAYQKAFAGFALLLAASLAIGLGIIVGYAPEPADDGDGDVAAEAAADARYGVAPRTDERDTRTEAFRERHCALRV